MLEKQITVKYLKTIEEYYNLLILNKEILSKVNLSARKFFQYAQNNQLISSEYVYLIAKEFGEYYVGKPSEDCTLDIQLLINFIVKHEASKYTREEIEDFFIYIICSVIIAELSQNIDGTSLDSSHNYRSIIVSYFYEQPTQTLQINPIPKKIRNIQLTNTSYGKVLEYLDLLETFLEEDEKSLEIIKKIKEELNL